MGKPETDDEILEYYGYSRGLLHYAYRDAQTRSGLGRINAIIDVNKLGPTLAAVHLMMDHGCVVTPLGDGKYHVQEVIP